MDKDKPAAGAIEPAATSGGGGSAEVAPAVVQPVASFGHTGGNSHSAGGPDGGTTLNIRCRLTLRNGKALFGGPKILGSEFGASDDGDVVVEFEGSASLDGRAATSEILGGGDLGGRGIGHPDQPGGQVSKQPRPAAWQGYEAASSEGGAKAV